MGNKTFPVTYMNIVDMHKDLSKICKDYDADASVLAPQFTFVTKDGKMHFGKNFVDFINKLKDELNVPVTYQGSYITRVVTVNYTEDIKLIKEQDNTSKPTSKTILKKPTAKRTNNSTK